MFKTTVNISLLLGAICCSFSLSIRISNNTITLTSGIKRVIAGSNSIKFYDLAMVLDKEALEATGLRVG